MVDVNLGSIGVFVHALVPNVPSTLSGTRLLEIADRKREFVENYTGTSIGSLAITIDHQDIITNLTAAQVVRSMMLTGADAGKVRIGDFTVDKTGNTNLKIAADVFENDAMVQLKSLGRKVTFHQAFN